MIHYSLSEVLFYLFLYSFLGWCIEIVIASLKTHQFVNKGFLNLPFVIPYGITAAVLMQLLPTLQHALLYQAIVSFIVFHIIWTLAEFFVQRICGLHEEDTSNIPTLSWKSQLLFEGTASFVFLALILIVHPFIHAITRMIPILIIQIISFVLSIILIFDFLFVLYSLRYSANAEQSSLIKNETQNLAVRIYRSVWNRLIKTYPGIQNSSTSKHYTFAKGLCLDKLIWIFLISSFLGALIEMCYCRLAGDLWMNRSSLLYGPFSVVWGAGAVVLTITLKPLAQKNLLWIFLAGFVIGGVYEYFCSVFTELIFGTVFWDYSHMATSIGGRTNAVYCLFWGLLAVVWMKLLYPLLEKVIEQIPPLYGKIITWAIAFVMLFNGILTSAAMIRYTDRITHPHPDNAIEVFLDTNYDDSWMEHRWPNMKITAH